MNFQKWNDVLSAMEKDERQDWRGGVEIADGDFGLPCVVISGEALSTVSCAIEAAIRYVGRKGSRYERAWFNFIERELMAKCQKATDAIFRKYIELKKSEESKIASCEKKGSK